MKSPQPTILIVEDDPGTTRLQQHRLEQAGFQAVATTTTQQALTELAQGSVDLIVLDCQLSGSKNGLDFYARLQEVGCDLPVLIVIGDDDEATAMGALQAGVRNFVVKSDEYLDDLPAAVTRVLKQEQTEQELAKSQAELAAIVDSAMHAIITVDCSLRITRFNAAAEAMFCSPAAEALGQPLVQFIPYSNQDEPELANAALQMEQFTQRLCSQSLGVRANGEAFPIEVSATPFRTAGQVHCSIVIRDATAHRRAEQALHESQLRFRLFTDTSPTVDFIQDSEGRLLFVNEAWKQTFRSMVDTWIGRTMDEVWPADVARRFREQDQAALASSEPIESLETLPTVQGEAHWLFYRFAFLDSTGRQLIGGIGVDLTDQMRAKEEVRRLNAELESRVQMRTAELQAANQELDAFSYSVSHDLRAPLRGIDGFSQALMEDCAEKLDEVELDYLRRVRAEAQRMGQLIDDLLELSRVSRATLRRTRMSLSSLVSEIADQLHRREPSRRVEFIIPAGLEAEADPRLLRIVLENLLGNAWKFTSTHPQTRIEFGVSTLPNGEAAWFVRDDGVGFDMSYAEQLFGAFQRLHAETDFPGTGIGLATVQRIIHRHGGRVWAESAVEQGATFYFTLAAGTSSPHDETALREFNVGQEPR